MVRRRLKFPGCELDVVPPLRDAGGPPAQGGGAQQGRAAELRAVPVAVAREEHPRCNVKGHLARHSQV